MTTNYQGYEIKTTYAQGLPLHEVADDYGKVHNFPTLLKAMEYVETLVGRKSAVRAIEFMRTGHRD